MRRAGLEFEAMGIDWAPWPVVLLRFLFLVLLRAFLILVFWNELLLPFAALMRPNLSKAEMPVVPAIAFAIVISLAHLDRPALRPIQKFIAA